MIAMCCMQLIRSLFSLLLSLAVVRTKRLDLCFGTRRLWPLMAARGFVGAASMTLYYEAIDRMPLADAVSKPTLHQSIQPTLAVVGVS